MNYVLLDKDRFQLLCTTTLQYALDHPSNTTGILIQLIRENYQAFSPGQLAQLSRDVRARLESFVQGKTPVGFEWEMWHSAVDLFNTLADKRSEEEE